MSLKKKIILNACQVYGFSCFLKQKSACRPDDR